MKRSLDQEQLSVQCQHGHPPLEMTMHGYYALKEAGAPMTILGFECSKCYRRLYVTAEIPRPSKAILDEMDAQE